MTLITGGGSDYVPDPRQEVEVIKQIVDPPVPFKPPVSGAGGAGTSTLNAGPSPAQDDTEPAGVWYRLAACETGRGGEPTWDYDASRYNWGSGIFDGGLQFLPSTWTAFKPESYPSHAYLATPAQQVEVGRRVAAAQGAGAWPSCTAKLGISTEDLLNG